MSLTAATITVYFIGLVNFHESDGRPLEALLPLATVTKPHKGRNLAVHHAEVVITGLSAGSTCTSLGGSWNGTDMICTVKVPAESTITLPRASAALNRPAAGPFESIPKLKSTAAALCPTITGLKATNRYAARVSLPTGELSACKSGREWVSRLTLSGATGKLEIGSKTADLNTGAVVYILHSPPPGSTSDEQHFFWYYTMYEGAGECGALPSISAGDPPCDDEVITMAHRHGAPFASGVGCTNTTYP